MSCNPYFYQVYKRVIQQGKYKNIYKDAQYGLTVWHDYMMHFGFGQKLDIDLPKAGIRQATSLTRPTITVPNGTAKAVGPSRPSTRTPSGRAR